MTGTLGFRALIENSPDAIALVNPEGQVLYASASTAKVLGYQPDELLGSNGLDLLHPQDRDHSARTLEKVVAVPQSHNRVQARLRRKDGQWLWVESTACNLLNEPHVQAIVLNYREIEIRRAEEELRQQFVDDLVRENAELKEFAHTLAHDLKEPLRTVGAFAELLVRGAALSEAEKEIGAFLVRGARRMTALVEALLAAATHTSKSPLSSVDLGTTVREAMENLKEALISSGAVVTLGSLPMVQANRGEIVRLFQNLFSNSVKYRSEAAVEIHVSADCYGSDLVVRVRDNGVGIAKEHHRVVFGMFRRLHGENIPGTGIGLAVCKKIVEEMGGRIWVESELGVGSTFCFTVKAGRSGAAASS
jgi:PAS domain S-box-containing protein